MNTWKFLGVAGAAAALAALASLTACTSDPDDPGAGTGGSAATGGGSSTGGGSATGGSGGGGSLAGTVCAAPVLIPATKPGIVDYDSYDGAASLKTWSFPLGGDTTGNVLGGTFAYGDRDTTFPETFEMVTGHESKYAFRIADTLAEKYGGGQGTWLSACLNATAFTGISFWIRGSAPSGNATLTVSMSDTTTATPAKPEDAKGTCTGDATTCVHPKFAVPVTDTWTQVKAPWTAFTAGSAPGAAVKPDGRNITQIQFGVDLVWTPDPATGVYAPTAAPYELVVDSLAFY